MSKKDDVVGRVAFGPAVPEKVKPRPVPHLLRRRPSDGFPASRDYDIGHVECRVVTCPANNSNGLCVMPSCIKIDADGRCKLGVRTMGKDKNVEKSD
jgi:hypothetical protein